MVPNGEYLISNLNKTKELPSNCDKDLQGKKFFFQMTTHCFEKCQQGTDEKEYLYFYLSSPSKDTTPFQMTYKQVLQVSITFDYLTKEGMGTILPFTSFLLFNNYFQTSSLEELRSRINNIWWSLY